MIICQGHRFVQGKKIVAEYLRNLIEEICINAFALEDAVYVRGVAVQFLGEPSFRSFRLDEYVLYFVSYVNGVHN